MQAVAILVVTWLSTSKVIFYLKLAGSKLQEVFGLSEYEEKDSQTDIDHEYSCQLKFIDI